MDDTHTPQARETIPKNHATSISGNYDDDSLKKYRFVWNKISKIIAPIT